MRSLEFQKLEVGDIDYLDEDFCPENVLLALKDCDGNKAPGSDDLNLNFIKGKWASIEEDFLNFLKEFHKDGLIIKHLNRNFLALIPKIHNPTYLSDYRPISLVGALYKLLIKVLANRLKKVMNGIKGVTQMAFVKGRQIMDSFVIANEIIHSWKKDSEWGLVVN
ncbi:hypothetical protein Ddye_024382 [Dipteronia dyeriana]|uniref:Reverse transcriptase domain-containing protein n=1 Tax=Dipteronia dyeriana TaxID=168575 RepID=A0AAD9TVM8_9ROSI|nr:hypothetical protein Ddye_024382 [Dipteronia dyeriana]